MLMATWNFFFIVLLLEVNISNSLAVDYNNIATNNNKFGIDEILNDWENFQETENEKSLQPLGSSGVKSDPLDVIDDTKNPDYLNDDEMPFHPGNQRMLEFRTNYLPQNIKMEETGLKGKRRAGYRSDLEWPPVKHFVGPVSPHWDRRVVAAVNRLGWGRNKNKGWLAKRNIGSFRWSQSKY